jgi:hypothetical protein
MKAIVNLIYDDATRNHHLEVQIRDGLKSPNAKLNAVDRAVEKACADDPDWTRWNLVSLD